MWTMSASAHDYSIKYQPDGKGGERLARIGPASIAFSIGVAFPPSDIPALTDLMRKQRAAGARIAPV
jgi:hypothetical protein